MTEDLKQVYLDRIREALDAPTGDDETFVTGAISRKQIIRDLNDYLEAREDETGVEHERVVELTRAECQEYARRAGQLDVDAATEGWSDDAYAEGEAAVLASFLSDILNITLHEEDTSNDA